MNYVIRHLAGIGHYVILHIQELGKITLFIANAFRLCFTRPLKIMRVTEQMYFVGVKSLLVVCLTGLFTGLVLGLQGYYTLSKFRSEGLLGSAIAISLLRELGPVLAALMVTGRAGSAIAAELGAMRISEQIDALDTMNIHPVKFLVSPRLLACILSLPLLTAIFDIVGILGGWLAGVVMLGVNSGIFFNNMIAQTSLQDVTTGLLKPLFFAVFIAGISCYRGFYCTTLEQGVHGSESVGLATTSSVVISSVIILILDYVLTALLM